MAYIANTAFERRVTDHAYSATDNITGKFMTSGTIGEDTICPAGFLCTKDMLMPLEGYDTALDNGNSWQMVTAVNGANGLNEPIYACNTYGVNELTDGVAGTTYKVGANTLGLAVPAGQRTTFTKINFDGESIYRFGVGNVDAAVADNGFFTIANGLLTPAAAAPTAAGTVYFQLLDAGNFTQGAYNGFGYIDVLAKAVHA